MLGKALLSFFKNFALKWFSSAILEQLLILILRKLVEATDSKIDDELFDVVFKQTELYKKKEASN